MFELEKLESMLSQGKISRREFLASLSALGLTVALSSPLLITQAHASVPKKGGRLRIGLSGASTADSLDSGGACCDPIWELNIVRQVRNCLVEIDPTGKPIPELAVGWESTPDASKWVFKIRKGVEFHNGKTLDANDVIYSINHHRGKDSKSSAKAILNPIKDIKADGKHTT